MRLFTAVNFSDNILDSLQASINALKTHGVSGSFSRRENLHVTVVFIGETSRVSDIKAVLESVSSRPFTLRLGGLGLFRGDILWCGVEKNHILNNIQAQFNSGIKQLGFKPEDRPFSPHLTVCREALIPTGLDIKTLSHLFPELITEISRVSLMRSERVNGRLIYTEIYAKSLQA